jgi:hypothetical protein
MDEREELKQELQLELQWVQYRKKMLDTIEEKLFQMKQLAQQAQEESLNSVELNALNEKLNDLAEQVRAIDSESRKMEDRKILE